MLPFIATAVILWPGLVGNLSAVDEQLPQERAAVARLKQSVDAVIIDRDETKPGQPVIEVRLLGERGNDDVLPELKHFKRLRSLVINATSITDTGLKILPELADLEEVTLVGGKLTDAALPHVASLKNLKTLGLCGSSFTDTGLLKLRRVSTLQSLSLHDTSITDAGLAALVELHALRELNIQGGKITGHGLRHLQSLKELRTLSLGATAVTDEGLQAIGGSPQLRSLDLRLTAITDRGLQVLGSLRELEDLYLDGAKISDAGLKQVGSLTTLKLLSLTSTGVSDAGLEQLKKLNRLAELNLDDTDVTDKADAELEKALPSLAAGRAKARREWAEINKREQKESSIPEADSRAILDEVVRHVLTDAELKDTREFYGTAGDKRLGLASDSPVKWPKDYVPSIKGYQFQYLAEGRYPERNENRKPALLGMRLDRLELTPPKKDELFGGPIEITLYKIAGGKNVIGGCHVYYAAEKKDGKWVVSCLGWLDP
jgi:hypothetical protein